MKNPFKPTAGARPPIVVGRSTILDSFKEGLEDGSGSPGLLTILTGPRGIGKTVMLSEAEDAARARGWVVISETATEGLLGRIGEAARLHLNELGTNSPGARLSSIGVAGFTVGFTLPPEQQVALRHVFEDLLNALAGHETGLLISVDEIHAANRSELTELAALVQHMIREDLPIGLIAGGLPAAVSDLLDEGVSTFLRRAERVDLHSASEADVRAALAATFEQTGIAASPEHLDRMAAATGGYPFLIQLVGYHVWRLARHNGGTTDAIVAEGLDSARKRLGSTVLASAFNGLSGIDKTFLLKMAEDDGPSRIGDIAARMGETTQYAGVYRRRLMDAGVIESPGHGLVDFAVPHLRSYLREHAALQSDLDSTSLE